MTHALRDAAQAVPSRIPHQAATRTADEAAAIAEALNRVKDAHYRRTLDEVVPALGNRTPRQCAKNKQGRARLASWLKDIENGELRQAVDNGTDPYDVSWMWRELGVEHER
jgi:hypothetical protein